MTRDTLATAVEAVRRHHGGLKPFLPHPERVDVLDRPARYFESQMVGPAKPITTPGEGDRDLRILVEGQAVKVLRMPGKPPETLRTLMPPVCFGVNSFALGQERRAAAVSTGNCRILRISPASFRRLAVEHPTFGVALLRWAALDLVDWIREHRHGTDAWSRRHGRRGDANRVFADVEATRIVVEVNPDTRRIAEEALRNVRCFQGQSMEVLADGLGVAVNLVTVPEGEAIVANGERDGNVYLLLDGTASMFGAFGHLLGDFRAGGGAQEVFIGEQSFLAQGARDGTVTATSDCLLLQVCRDAVPWMLEHHPALAVLLHKAMLRTVCWRLIETDDERERYTEALKGTVVPAQRR